MVTIPSKKCEQVQVLLPSQTVITSPSVEGAGYQV